MKEKNNDRRIKKTRLVLKESLIELMNTKSVKHITVKELCEKADINRGTFYLHYRDVFDMLEQLEKDFFQELSEILDKYSGDITESKKHLLENLFYFSLANKNFCNVMLSEHGDIAFIQKLLDYLNERVKKVYHYNSVNAEQSVHFIIYGCIGLIVNWLTTGTKESPEKMAEIADSLIMNGISELT